jgi:hypothetical protein
VLNLQLKLLSHVCFRIPDYKGRVHSFHLRRSIMARLYTLLAGLLTSMLPLHLVEASGDGPAVRQQLVR